MLAAPPPRGKIGLRVQSEIFEVFGGKQVYSSRALAAQDQQRDRLWGQTCLIAFLVIRLWNQDYQDWEDPGCLPEASLTRRFVLPFKELLQKLLLLGS